MQFPDPLFTEALSAAHPNAWRRARLHAGHPLSFTAGEDGLLATYGIKPELGTEVLLALEHADTLDLSGCSGFSLRVHNPDSRTKILSLRLTDASNSQVFCTVAGSFPGRCDVPLAGGITGRIEFSFRKCLHPRRVFPVEGCGFLSRISDFVIGLNDPASAGSGSLLLSELRLHPASGSESLVDDETSHALHLEAHQDEKALLGECLAELGRATGGASLESAVWLGLKALERFPATEALCGAIESLYRRLSTDQQRTLKRGIGQTYRVVVAQAPGRARALSRLHARLVNIASDEMPLFSRVLSVHAINSNYSFTDQPPLLESARRIRDELGCDTIKISLNGWGVERSGRHIGWDSWGAVPAACPGSPSSLLELVTRNRAYLELFDMPFSNFLMWAYPLGYPFWPDWSRPMSEAERTVVHRELYDLATFLLTRYRGSGKTFLLGNWEGDWHLYNLQGKEHAREPDAQRIATMREWLNLRQQAVDDAKRDTPPVGVRVFNYAECNHPVRGARGRASMLQDVIPHIQTDFVSYSSYDLTNSAEPTERYERAVAEMLDLIEANLPPRDIPGRRVWLGEYGYPVNGFYVSSESITPELQDVKARATIRAGLKWGSPFIIYWEFYCNERRPDGEDNGFWMIDSRNRLQPVFHSHRRFLDKAALHVDAHLRDHRRPPSMRELCDAGLDWI